MRTHHAPLSLVAVFAAACHSAGGSSPSSPPPPESPSDASREDAAAATNDAAAAAAPPASDAGAPAPPLAGGWRAASVADPEVLAAARAAVGERQRQQGGTIQLRSIAWAQEQVVSGMNYRLGLEVTVNGATQQVTAEVWVQAWRNSRQLTHWAPGFVHP